MYQIGELVEVVNLNELSKKNINGVEEDCFEFLNEHATVKYVDKDNVSLHFIKPKLNNLVNRLDYQFTINELSSVESII